MHFMMMIALVCEKADTEYHQELDKHVTLTYGPTTDER
jgi:hypothetical protein